MSVERELCTQDLDEEATLEKVLTWGLSYRNLKQMEQAASISQKASPLNLPYQMCTALQRMKKKKMKKRRKKDPSSRPRTIPVPKLTLLERSALPQEEYMELLSTPNITNIVKEPRKKKRNKVCCKCRLVPLCRPRLIQMSIPNKRYVWETWKAYQNFLPAEILIRFDQLLKSGDNLDLNIARCYFKKLEKERRKLLRKKQKLLKKKKKNEATKGERRCLKLVIDDIATTVTKYIELEPLYVLNYKQMMTSNQLLRFFNHILKVKKRNTQNVYKKTLIEISDKLVRWLDGMYFSADIQPIDSKELLGIVEVSSVETMIEEEGEGMEGEGEGVESEEARMAREAMEQEGMIDEFDLKSKEAELEDERFEAESIFEQRDKFGIGEQEGSFIDNLSVLDEDLLEKLIQILSQSDAEFLATEVDPENMPGVTYMDVLIKLRQLHEGRLLQREKGKPILEDIMVIWAKNNDPDKVDEKILDTIHETSQLLGDFFQFTDDALAKKKLLGEEGEGLDEAGSMRGEEGEGGWGQGEGEDIESMREAEAASLRAAEEAESIRSMREAEAASIAAAEAASIKAASIRGVESARGPGEGGIGGEGEGEDLILAEETLMAGQGEDQYGELAESEFGEGEFLGIGEGEGAFVDLGEGEEEARRRGIGEGEEGRLKDELRRIIKGHKPDKIVEHTPGTICCLSLKIWAVWLLEIAENAHNWTTWIGDIIKQVRHFAATIRGDVKAPSGEKKQLYKKEWREFVKDTELKVIAWRQYSQHVKELSTEIMENFHDKKVNCCPKCLQDHLIKNVVTAHETLQALTEAINCAEYWQRCLDRIVEETSKFTIREDEKMESQLDLSEESSSVIEIEELSPCTCNKPLLSEGSWESVMEIEELDLTGPPAVFEILELDTSPIPDTFEVELLTEPDSDEETTPSVTVSGDKAKKGKKGKKR